MVAPLVKALGALVVGTPLAVVLGLTARSVSKQQDAAVPVVRVQESPLAVQVFSHYLDKRTHQPLSPTSIFKRGYVAYDLRVENLSGRDVRGVRVEMLDAAGEVLGHVRVGELSPHSAFVFRLKKSWARVLEAHRVAASSPYSASPSASAVALPEAVLTWRALAGRRRAVAPLSPTRVLGTPSSELKRRAHEKAPVTAPIMA